jgi:hypothetical protein
LVVLLVYSGVSALFLIFYLVCRTSPVIKAWLGGGISGAQATDMDTDADPPLWLIDTYLSAVNAQQKAIEEESGKLE